MSQELVDTSLGSIELNVGSWAHMLEKASGTKATYIGKPNPLMFELALESMGLGKEEVVMVGDNLTTDILGARSAGIKSVLVKSGEFTEGDLNHEITPDFTCDSVRDVADILEL